MAAPFVMSVQIEGARDLQRYLREINPELNDKFVTKSLTNCGLLVQDNAARVQIERGGQHPPLAHRLTSRHGGEGLVGSIRVDRRNVPRYVDVGSDKAYARIHEEGGTVHRTSSKGTSYSATYPKRAYLAPALRAVEHQFPDVFAHEWGKVINSVGGSSRFRGRGVPGGETGGQR